MSGAADSHFKDHKASTDLGRQALRGGIASVAMQYGNGALQIIAAIVLARLLTPEDFGLVAIVTVLTSFAPAIIDFGLADAVVQKGTITRGQVSSLFWLSTSIGSVIALVVVALSSPIATIYREPKLEPIALCTAVTFVLWGVSNIHVALLRRAMRFGAIARIQLPSTLMGIAVAIFMARQGYGYWALVFRSITSAACVALGAWFVCNWRPGRPKLDDEVRSMIRFGLHVVSFSATYSFARAVDRIGLGLFYRPEVVGYYQNATTLYDNSIYSALHQLHTVGSTSLSKLQADPAALRQKYEAALSAVAFFVMPMAAILSLTARDVTVLLLGERWRAAGVLLSIIALRGIFQVIENSQGWLHISLGRADRWRNWGIVSLGVQLAVILGGLPFGPKGVAAASVIASLLIAVPSINYAGRPIGVDAALVIRAAGPQLIAAIGALLTGWAFQMTMLTDYSGVSRVLLSGALCSCIYLAIVAGIFRRTEPMKLARTVLQDLLQRR